MWPIEWLTAIKNLFLLTRGSREQNIFIAREIFPRHIHKHNVLFFKHNVLFFRPPRIYQILEFFPWATQAGCLQSPAKIGRRN